MQSFSALSALFETRFNTRHFPEHTTTLYDPAQYILQLGGKRVRPVAVLMGNELFGDIHPDAWEVARAIELFHNFSLIHDDIMDRAPVRRGMPTVHEKYGVNTALLAGDVMLVKCYECLSTLQPQVLQPVLQLFNRTAAEVCEGQQLDMDFEQRDRVHLDEYLNMITLKTSVLLAASLQLGALLAGTGERNQQHLYGFGKNLGIAFQVQDDYLDAFGDPASFGKQVGGDILSNKKTFLMIRALETASEPHRQQLTDLLGSNPPDKVAQVLEIYRAAGVHEWAEALKEQFLQTALTHLDEIAVVSKRKEPLRELALYLIRRNR